MNASYSESDKLFSDQEVTNYQSTTWDMFLSCNSSISSYSIDFEISASKQSLKD